MFFRTLRKWVTFWCADFLMIGLATSSSAQLQDTNWQEWIEFSAGDFNASVTGGDINAPDRLFEQFVGSDYFCEASVSFGPSGPPYATVRADLTIDTPALTPFLVVRFELATQFHPRQLSAPPVLVNFVPVTIERSGHAGIVSSSPPQPVPMDASVFTEFHVSSDLGSIEIADEIAANNSGVAQQSAFAQTDQFWMALQETGSVFAFTELNISTATSSGRVEAMGWIDPIIEVADQMIPGTSNSYRDFFEIERSPGFWALPTQSLSWGAVKEMFEH